MSARTKLNGAYLLGGLIVATVAGTATQSLGVFLVALGLCLASNVAAGNIRPRRR